MAATGNSSITTGRAWARRHPRVSAISIALLSFLLGVGAGAGGTESDLTAARQEVHSVRADADAAIDELDTEVAKLQGRVIYLTEKNETLDEQITRMNARRQIPDIVGMKAPRALDLQDVYGWTATVERRYSNVAAGTILAQSPSPGTMMRYGAPYTLVVAKPLPELEGVVGMWRAGAERALGRWNVVVVEQVSTRPAGRVIAMTPTAGSGLIPGGTVTITIAKKAPPPPPVAEAPIESGCTAGYSPCLPPASDYDCSSGTGDGPKYTGYVTVTGPDPYDLDADGDGAGCES